MDAVVLNCVTQFNIVWHVGTFPFLPMSKCRRKTRCVTVAESLFKKKKTFPQQTLDAFATNAACWLKTSNRCTRRCVFHRATYEDVGMALNLNSLIVSAPPCMFCICYCCVWLTHFVRCTLQTVRKCWVLVSRNFGEATACCGFVSEWAASRLRRRSWTRTRRMQMWNCQHTWAERNYCNTATSSWKTYRPWWSGPSGDSARSSVTPRRGCACCSGMFCLEVYIRNCYYTGCLKKKFVLCLVCLVTGP